MLHLAFDLRTLKSLILLIVVLSCYILAKSFIIKTHGSELHVRDQ